MNTFSSRVVGVRRETSLRRGAWELFNLVGFKIRMTIYTLDMQVQPEL